MAATKFFPPLTAIMPVDALPNELGFVKTGLTNILSHVYFRDLQSSHNDRGDAAFYSLSIVSLKRLDVEIPGTGIFLILNPGHDPLASGFSEFPVTLSYRWPILGYVRQFNLETFSFRPADIFDLALRVVGISQRQLVERALSLFVPSLSPVDTFVDDVNALFGTSIAHPAAASADPLGDVLEEINGTTGINGAGGAVFVLYLFDAASEDATRARIKTFFEDFFDGEDVEAYLRRLLVPKIEATLQVGLAVEFPRNVLEPLDSVGGEPLPDQTIKTWLTFDAGSFFYSTERGIGFDQMLTATLNHPSRIAGTGFGLSLHRAKLDISRTTNIPEADADGRPVDFVGVYIDDATISFPTFWNQDSASTGVIRGSKLLMGTGGVSGTLALEAVTAGHPAPVVNVRFGEDFRISLDAFSITLKQNAITGSKIEGTLVIPGFKDVNDEPAEIRIKVDIRQGGDFDVTAYEEDGFKQIKCGGIFSVTVKSVFFGKEGDDFYLGVSGSIKFTHSLLSTILKDEIEVEKLVIHSSGRIEIKGGMIPLPRNIRFPIGPAELSISAIGFGAYQRVNADGTTRDFRYFEFNGGVDMNPGVVDVRGRGIRFYFPLDNVLSDCFLEIKSLAIDVVIPGNASADTAALLISGYLSMGGTPADPEYEGGVSIGLPKLKIKGGASMKMRPRVPAFLIKAFIELSTPIMLGATGLAFYGFEGLFGMRYVATKQAAGIQETDAWFDYYKAKTPPQGLEGVTVSKFEGPQQTKNYDSAFSIGVGALIATGQDAGRTFSGKFFILLSLPGLIYIEGRANILGERVSYIGDEPPLFAMIAITSQSVETGVGVTYKLPKKGAKMGQILDFNAEMRAAFFFKNSSAWFINFGTEKNPTVARVLSMFDATSYLMISAAGIKAGAGVTFGFKKSYAGGMVRASVGVYIKVGGFISFQGPQIGGFAMLGGHVDASLLSFSFYLVIDTSLSVEAPKPFYVQGSVHLCVGVTIGFWKVKKRIEKCFNVDFKWEKDPNKDTTPVLPFADLTQPGAQPPLKATNMLSGETFNVMYLGTTAPTDGAMSFNEAVLPLDSWIDIEFLKGLLPGPDVDARIGRLSGQAPSNYIDYVPPAEVPHKVKHAYSVKKVEIKTWDGGAWVDYRPYQAMSPPDALAALAAAPSAYKDGFWQNSGAGFNKLRLLAETTFSYMQQGEPGWYVPEQLGVTSATLFCRTKRREKLCLRWVEATPGTVLPDGAWRQRETVLFRVSGAPGTVVDWNSHFGIPRSLMFANEAVNQIVLHKPCVEVQLKLTTFSTAVAVRFYERKTADAGFVYTLVETRTLTQTQLLAQVQYNDPARPVAKVEIDPVTADPAAVYVLRTQLDALYRRLYETNLDRRRKEALLARIRKLEQELALLQGRGCTPEGIGQETVAQEIPVLERKLEECRKQLSILQAAQGKVCAEAEDLRALFKRCFAQAPSTLSYEIFDERAAAGSPRFGFRVYGDATNAVLFSSTRRYGDSASAERALFDTLELAPYVGDYALMAGRDGRFFFQLVDTSGQFIAVSPTLFPEWKQLFAFVNQTQATFRAARAAGEFALARHRDGKLLCEESFEHLACWDDLPSMGTGGEGRCKKIVAGILSARDAFCSKYEKLYRELYACNKHLLDELTLRCEELSRELDVKRRECEALGNQLAALIHLQSLIDKNGALRPPEGSPCSTLLHEVCCLSLEDYEFNLSAPAQAAIEQDYQNAVAAIEKTLTPVWRPGQKYYVHLRVADSVDDGPPTDGDFYFGFRTSKPLGFFHLDPSANYVAQGKTPDQYMLTGLKAYIDYRRSIPNADGELVRAKPLFYEDARLLLFFTKRYVYHFFSDWPAYEGLPALTGNAMQIIIKDPAENTSIPNPPPPEITTSEIPQAVVSWPTDDDPRIPEDIRTLLNLRNPELLNPDFEGGDCWASGGEMITPASVHASVKLKYLKPLKLYTAIVNNVYQGETKEVHSYVFQTSRYANFEEQVNSYHLDDGKGNKRDAVFRVAVPLSVADLSLMYDIVAGNMSPANAALAGTWADPFDRLVEGVLKLTPLDAAVSTEFNLVRNTVTDAVVAMWIRNPEPLNHPKFPDEVLEPSLRVMNGLNPDLSYEVLFSKDYSQAFVMHPSRVIPVSQMQFRFAYLEWDGSDYVERSVVLSDFIPTNV